MQEHFRSGKYVVLDSSLEERISNTLKEYVIEFDRFDMVDTDDDDVKENLIKIFKVTDSSVINDYPIEITFNEDSLEYRK